MKKKKKKKICSHSDGPLPSFVTENVATIFPIGFESYSFLVEMGPYLVALHPLLVPSENDPTNPTPPQATATSPHLNVVTVLNFLENSK